MFCDIPTVLLLYQMTEENMVSGRFLYLTEKRRSMYRYRIKRNKPQCRRSSGKYGNVEGTGYMFNKTGICGFISRNDYLLSYLKCSKAVTME